MNCSTSEGSGDDDLPPGQYVIPLMLAITNPLDQGGRLYEINETVGYSTGDQRGTVGAYNSEGPLTAEVLIGRRIPGRTVTTAAIGSGA